LAEVVGVEVLLRADSVGGSYFMTKRSVPPCLGCCASAGAAERPRRRTASVAATDRNEDAIIGTSRVCPLRRPLAAAPETGTLDDDGLSFNVNNHNKQSHLVINAHAPRRLVGAAGFEPTTPSPPD
jgi:hypothetical protein